MIRIKVLAGMKVRIVGITKILWLSACPTATGSVEGYYPLDIGYGYYSRHDVFVDNYDGIPLGETTTTDVDDSVVSEGQGEGYIHISSSGEVTGSWLHTLNINATWNATYRGEPDYWGSIAPVIQLRMDVTGTVAAVSDDSFTLALDILLDCEYLKAWTYRGGWDPPQPRFGPDVVSWVAHDIPLSLELKAERREDGGFRIKLPMMEEVLPVIAEANPGSSDDDRIEIRYFTWPETHIPYMGRWGVPPSADIPGLAVRESSSADINAWVGGPTRIDFDPPLLGLNPVHPEYHLLGVSAPYGYLVTGDGDSGAGQSVHFRYGTESFETVLAGGRAFAPFNYAEPPDVIEADIISGASSVDTLIRPLHKVTLPPWAEPASAWTASPGVTYARTIHWPVSLATTQTLQNASVFSGIWGISGMAESNMLINAHSSGIPTDGTLEARVSFQAAGREIGFTLGGRHLTTLNASGLTLTGQSETELTLPLLNMTLTPLSLVPGLQSAVGNIHPFLKRVINSTGLHLRSQLDLIAAADYAADVEHPQPYFTAGSIYGHLDVSARLHLMPQMFRDILSLGIEGGGGLEAEVQLAPAVELVSLGGRLYFMATASLFNLSATTDHELIFGDYTSGVDPSGGWSNPVGELDLSAGNILPAGSYFSAALKLNDYYPTVVASIPDPTYPSPASGITLRKSGFDSWDVLQLSPSDGAANLSPTIGIGRLRTPTSAVLQERQAIVWARSTTPAPTNGLELETFANGMELRFREFYPITNQLVGGTQALTSNNLCDFGPVIPHVTLDKPVRVFWARSHGTDFTGAVTPLTLHTRQWLYRQTSNPEIGWTPEAQVVGGLTHIIDWKPIVIDEENAAVVIVRDDDGDYETLEDSELWLVREIDGDWGAPVRLTNNNVPDEQPVLSYSEGALRLAWRRGNAIVYLPDAFTHTEPQVLLPDTVTVGPGFSEAELFEGTSDGETGLMLVWPEENGIAVSYTGMDAPAIPGGILPQPVHYPFGNDTVTGFSGWFSESFGTGFLDAVILTTGATEGSPASIPETTHARLEKLRLTLNPSLASEVFSSPQSEPQSVSTGGRISFDVLVKKGAGASFQWLLNGVPIPGATSTSYRKSGATLVDSGIYSLRITDDSGISTHPVGTVAVTETFAEWAARHELSAPHNDRHADPDSDGSPNLLEYLFDTDPRNPLGRPRTHLTAAERGAFANPYDAFTFDVSASATDCTFVVEYSRDLITWDNVENLPGYYGDAPRISTSSSDGLRKSYFVIIDNNNDGRWNNLGLDWSKSFMRVRILPDD